jgi:hypothetical protein
MNPLFPQSRALLNIGDSARLTAAASDVVCWLTSGRTPVRKARFNRADDKMALGQAYVSKADIALGHRRICGVASLADLDPTIVSRIRAGRAATAA